MLTFFTDESIADKLGANTPEARDRFNKTVESAQQYRNYIQNYANGSRSSALGNFTNVFSGGTPPSISGMPNFKGTYDYGSGGKYDYGKGQWVTTPAPSSGNSSSGTSNTSKSKP